MAYIEIKRNKLSVGIDFDVWLDTEEGANNDICIGTGDTREAAIADATADLEDALQQLRNASEK